MKTENLVRQVAGISDRVLVFKKAFIHPLEYLKRDGSFEIILAQLFQFLALSVYT